MDIRFVVTEDKSFWYRIDKHLSEFDKKVRDHQGYVLLLDNKPVGLLRYNLFWDNILYIAFIEGQYQKQGFVRSLIEKHHKICYTNLHTSCKLTAFIQNLFLGTDTLSLFVVKEIA